MTEREFQIAFERLVAAFIPTYNTNIKINSDTIFHFINAAKNEYVKLLYRLFQHNQEISDKLRTLVITKVYSKDDFTLKQDKWEAEYPEDYLFALGEKVLIKLNDNKCANLHTKASDVIEATIESVDRILSNSLSEYHLHHNQARPVRVYTDNKIVLYTDGSYGIYEYKLTYLKPAKDLGKNLIDEYKDLPEHTHQEIIDAAVNIYISSVASNKSSKNEDK